MRFAAIVWIVKEVRAADCMLKRIDHWIGAIALILAIIGLAAV